MRLLPLLLVLFGLSSNAQTASNFNIDDIDGVNRDLFTELNAGNVVVLKFFTNWCSICNNTADEVIAIYEQYQNNADPVVFWALDRDQSETNVHATTYRNNHNIPFPVIGEAYSVAQQFGVVYQPEYYVVRPDRSYVKKTNYTAMNTAVDEALASLSLTGIDEAAANSNISVSENTITWNAEVTAKAKLRVMDTSGRLIVNRTISGQESVSIPESSAGIYLYTLQFEGQIFNAGKIGVIK